LDNGTALHRRCSILERMPSSPHTSCCGGASTCAQVSVPYTSSQRAHLPHTAPLTRRRRALLCSVFGLSAALCSALPPTTWPSSSRLDECQKRRLQDARRLKQISASLSALLAPPCLTPQCHHLAQRCCQFGVQRRFALALLLPSGHARHEGTSPLAPVVVVMECSAPLTASHGCVRPLYVPLGTASAVRGRGERAVDVAPLEREQRQHLGCGGRRSSVG
jgi:hypothetical protein